MANADSSICGLILTPLEGAKLISCTSLFVVMVIVVILFIIFQPVASPSSWLESSAAAAPFPDEMRRITILVTMIQGYPLSEAYNEMLLQDSKRTDIILRKHVCDLRVWVT